MNKLKTILIRNQIIFPGEVIGFSSADSNIIKAQLDAYENDEELFILRYKADNEEERKDSAYTETNGVIAKVESVKNKDNGVIEVVVRALRRGKLISLNNYAENEYEAEVEEYIQSDEGFDRMLNSLQLTMRGYSDVTTFTTAVLEEVGLALITGAGFGAPENVRLSYATDLDTLKEAVSRLKAFMEK